MKETSRRISESIRRAVTVFLAIVMVMGSVTFLTTQTVHAELDSTGPIFAMKNNQKIVLSSSKYDKAKMRTYSIGIKGKLFKAKILSVKSSNSKVLKVEKSWGGYFVYVYPRNIGTGTLKVQAKYKGKVKNYTFKVKVVKYQNPFKEFLINGKDYKNYIKGTDNWIDLDENKYRFETAEFNYTLNKNWKVVKENRSFDGTKIKKLETGKVYSIKTDTYLRKGLVVKNKKTGHTVVVQVLLPNLEEDE